MKCTICGKEIEPEMIGKYHNDTHNICSDKCFEAYVIDSIENY